MKIVYAVYDNRRDIKDTEAYFRFKGASLYYLKRQNAGVDIITGNDITGLLREAVLRGYDRCVVISSGLLARDFDFTHNLELFCKSTEFGVAGHILYWPGKWLQLHKQFFIVNLQAYAACEQPEFGDWQHVHRVVPKIERSVENFHDDYTPVWVRRTAEYENHYDMSEGWNLLKMMFMHNYAVVTLPESLRFGKIYAYPDHETAEFMNCVHTQTTYPDQNPNQRELVNLVATVKDQIWLFNSESMRIDNQGEFAVAANTASGFKILDLLREPRLTAHARIVVYDFNPLALEWYKHFYTYQGTDLVSCITEFAHRDKFTWTNKEHTHELLTPSFYTRLHEVYEYFNGKEEFEKYWQQFKTLAVEFHRVDLYNEPQKFAELLGSQESVFVNLSNIFSTDAGNIRQNHADVIAAQVRVLAYLFTQNPRIQISIHDFWNRYYAGAVGAVFG